MTDWRAKYKAKEGKFVSLHATKAYRGVSDIAPFILNLYTRWR